MSKKKILIDGRWLGAGRRGIGVFTHSLLSALSHMGCDEIEVTVAVRSHVVTDFRNDFDHSFKLISIPNISDPFLDFFFFSFYLIFVKFDLVHFTGNTGMLIGRHSCKVLLTIHDVSYMKRSVVVPWPNRFRQIVGRMYRRLVVPICARRADKILTVSNFAAQDLKLELMLETAPDFVYHGVEHKLPSADVVSPKLEVVRGKYLVIGGSDPQKNVICVVKAFISLYDNYHSNAPEVVIVGLSCIDFFKCNSVVVITPNIKFLGYIDHQQVQHAIGAAKCIIVPSFYESFGLPVIESLSFGKAVICSDKGALREIGGGAATYFDPDCFLTLVDAIKSFEANSDVSDKLINWNATYLSKFSWVVCAKKYFDSYIYLTSV